MKKEIILAILSSIIIIFIIFVLSMDVSFASSVDYSVQHVHFFDYLREQIINTKSIFLKFAPNLGSGQNIYNISYYGLLSPYLLLSIIFYFVNTKTFLLIVNFLALIINNILMYKILKEDNNEKYAFISSIIFILSTPFIFHIKRHFMFINYIPFLLMGILSINYYFKTKKTTPLIISIFLILFTSYYYSISSFCVLFIYMLYKLIKLNKFNKENFINLIRVNLKIYIIGILVSSLIILPTFYCLFSSRSGGNSTNYISLFIPYIAKFLYNPYGLGIGILSYIALFSSVFSKKKEYKFLSILLIIITFFPIFSYILNGTLYVREKIFIPFIPLFIILTNNFLCSFKKFNINKYVVASCTIVPLILINILINIYNEKFVENNYFEKIEKDNSLINNIKDNEFYRLSLEDNNMLVNYTPNNIFTTSFYSSFYNDSYYKFITKTMNNEFYTRNMLYHDISRNTIFNLYMNNKYVVDKNLNMYSYNKIISSDKLNIYKSDKTLPLIYSSNNLMSQSQFEKIGYPYNLQYLFSHIIVEKKIETKYENLIQKVDLNYKATLNNLEIKKIHNMYNITAKNKNLLNITLDKSFEDKLLMVTFENEKVNKCFKGDSNININGIKNKLTCSSHIYFNKNYTFNYVLNKNIKNLEVNFSEGEINISNINFYTIDTSLFENNFNKAININVKGNIISSDINIDNSSYVNINIPYDKGFTVLVDGKKVKYEKTNTAFIGFKIDAGKHKIKLIYTPPLYNISFILSIIGIMFLVINYIYENKKFKHID
ncbi:MAG: YfhO family protein [Bacilli bacterium]